MNLDDADDYSQIMIFVIISIQYVYISVLSIRYSIKGEKVKHTDHLVDHEEGGHNEERFFFGLCPISLNTLSIQNEATSTSLRELKVITINGRVINRKCTRTNALKTNTKYPKHFKEDKLVWEEIFVSCKSSIDKCPKLKKCNDFENSTIFRHALGVFPSVMQVEKNKNRIGSDTNLSAKFYNNLVSMSNPYNIEVVFTPFSLKY